MAKTVLLGVWDYVVFAIVLVISAAIGIVYSCIGGRQKTTKEFLMADRQMGLIPIGLSLLVSFQSAIMILGYTAEMYTQGVQFWMLNAAIALAIILTAVVFVPFLRPLHLTSSFEYLERRFNSKAVSKVGSFLGLVSGTLYMGTATYAPSTAIEAVTGFPVWASIMIVAGVSTFYTTLGGMKAVLWTDVFQFIVMLLGILAVSIQGALKIGGIDVAWNAMEKGQRLNFFEFDPNPTTRHTFWSILIGGTIMWLGVYAISQGSIQRVAAAKSEAQAKWAVLLNIPGLLALSIPVALNGMIVYAYYTHKNCGPLENKQVTDPNQLLPFFVTDVLTDIPGFPGLFLATLFSGALSSNSSTLSGIAAVTWEDYLKPIPRLRNAKEWVPAFVSKIVVLVFGVIGGGVAYLCYFVGGPITQIALSFGGASGGPLTGIFLLGMFFPWANWIGGVVGGLGSFSITLWLVLGGQVNKVRSCNPALPTVPISGCNASYASSVMNFTTTETYTTTTFVSTALMGTTSSGPDVNCADSFEGIEYFYAVSYLWTALLGCVLCIIFGLIASFITGYTRPREIEPELLAPFYRRMFFKDHESNLKTEKVTLEAYHSKSNENILKYQEANSKI